MDHQIADHLSEFNRLILTYQDEAYTLAWYLLTNQAQAEAVMEKVVEMAFRCFSSDHAHCRQLIFKLVVEQCRRQKRTAWSSAKPGIRHNLRIVTEQERVVVVLIDILRLSYSEAADVMEQSVNEIGRLLCLARRHLVKTN